MAMVSCSACTVVNVEGGDVRRYAGTLRVVPEPQAKMVSVARRTYGLAADGRSLIVGYEASRTIVVPRDSRCAAFVVVDRPTPEMLAQWHAFARAHPEICVNQGEQR